MGNYLLNLNYKNCNFYNFLHYGLFGDFNKKETKRFVIFFANPFIYIFNFPLKINILKYRMLNNLQRIFKVISETPSMAKVHLFLL